MTLTRSFAKLLLLYTGILVVSIPLKAQKNEATLLRSSEKQLKDYDSVKKSKVMVVGTHHFDESVLQEENQNSIQRLVALLSEFNPTRIVLEWEPEVFKKANVLYQKFINDSISLDKRYNEVYQIGFRLAKKMNHDSIYFFDDQTEFIGSLKNFSFDSFGAYAEQNDEGFYNQYEDLVELNYNHNENIFKKLDLLDEIILRNSSIAQKVNAQRMHSFEVRVGIQKSWIGPDWLGRWYRRNVRMLANLIKMNHPGERILIVVGDNHKWTLDSLINYTPEFELVSSWNFLTGHYPE